MSIHFSKNFYQALCSRQTAQIPPAVLLQPLPMLRILRQNLPDLRIKLRRVIHVLAMTKLMHHHTVNHLVGHQHQQTIKVQIPLGGTAPPAGSLIPDGDPPVTDTDPFSVKFNFLRNDFQRPVCQFLNLLPRKRRKLILRFFTLLPQALLHGLIMLLNPCRFTVQKDFDLTVCHVVRRADEQTGRGQFKGDGGAVGAADGGGYRHGETPLDFYIVYFYMITINPCPTDLHPSTESQCQYFVWDLFPILLQLASLFPH